MFLARIRRTWLAQCGLRRDCGGTHTSPVGYLEGVFVQEEYRGQSVATALARLRAWAGGKGQPNLQATGWTTPQAPVSSAQAAEAGRIICFTKRL
ncbi:MAG: GNAT family N-acetyltransferase [Ruthenibacterium lactatiformans]